MQYIILAMAIMKDTSHGELVAAAGVDKGEEGTNILHVNMNEQHADNSLASNQSLPIDSLNDNDLSESSNSKPSIVNGSAAGIDENGNTVATASGVQAKEPEATRTTFQTVVIMLCLCFSVFLAALDVTIIATALPTISEHFHSSSGYTWIGSAFLLANSASVPVWGKFSDIFGRKPLIISASVIFFVGSLLSGVSVSIGMLIVARAIQGIGGGGLIILANICIADLFSPRNRGVFYAMIGATWVSYYSLSKLVP